MTTRPSSDLPGPWYFRRFVWLLPLAAAGVLLLFWLQGGHAVDWDEIEFARATAWVRMGRLPYRDFWEHHTPLQWFLFAPATALAQGPGVAAILALRWSQLLVWIPAGWALKVGMDEAGVPGRHQLAGFALILASPFFFMKSMEFRVDCLATALLAMGWALWVRPGRTRRRAVLAGVCFALTILANLRMGPVAVLAAGLTLVLDPDRRRWGFCRQGGDAVAGSLAVAAGWALYLGLTGSARIFWQRAITENYLAATFLMKVQPQTLFSKLQGGLFSTLDPVGIAFGLLALPGFLLALRGARRPGGLHFLAVIQAAHLFLTLRMGVLYAYHFQTTFFLAIPFAALTLHWLEARWPTPEGRKRWALLVLGGLWLAVGLDGWDLAFRATRADLRYQDRIMKEVDARTDPGERVFDGCGWALRREPAYQYWFIPLLVRLLVAEGRMEPYQARQAAAAPPAAVVFNLRVLNWLHENPELGATITQGYLPRYSHLWLPAPNGVLAAGGAETTWSIPRAGRYRVLASPDLAGHPWFRMPMAVLFHTRGDLPGVAIRPGDFPAGPPPELRLRLDGAPWRPGADPVFLAKGARLGLTNAGGTALGVMVVPADVDAWFQVPPRGASIDAQVILGEEEDDGS